MIIHFGHAGECFDAQVSEGRMSGYLQITFKWFSKTKVCVCMCVHIQGREVNIKQTWEHVNDGKSG